MEENKEVIVDVKEEIVVEVPVKVEEVIVPLPELKNLNLYRKLQNIRVELQELNLKKSGLNKFSNFSYYELADILPSINKLMAKYGVFAYEEITSETAIVTVIDCDNIETEPFKLQIPSTSVELKGATPVQMIGAQQSYLRRYLYMALFGIVEADTLDAVSGKDDGKKPPKGQAEPPKADSPIAMMKALCTEKSSTTGIGREKVLAILDKIAKVKNPNSVKDEATAIKVIEALNELK